MGAIVAVLLARGSLPTFTLPLWVRAAVAVSLALGTALGGRRIVRTVGRGFYRSDCVDALAAQAAAGLVILASTAVAAPVSTSTVVASTVVGVGADRRPRHVRWVAFGETVVAWGVTIPACAALGATLCALERIAA